LPRFWCSSQYSSSGGGTGILQCRAPNLRRRCVAILIAAAALALTGCKPRATLALHYLPGFVPGSQNVFGPAKIAVPPTTGDIGVGDYQVGSIYADDGNVKAPLLVRDLGLTFNGALIRGLKDAGLMPVALDSNPEDGKPPEGSDFILTSALEQVELNKRFSPNWTIHGQYFTMNALVRVRYILKNRDGDVLFSSEINGTETEPPNPVGAEIFLPLETEPAESLSVAMSRAVGFLIVDPKFRDPLPLRAAAATPTPSPSAPQP
jgi:hypothetical protein